MKPVQCHFHLPDLLVQLRRKFFLLLTVCRLPRAKYLLRGVEQLLLPLRDLIRMDLMLSSQFSHRPLPLDGLNRQLGLELR